MIASRPLLLSTALLVSVVVCACSTVGEKSFSCPGRPPGVHCMTTSEVYAATEDSDVVAPTAPHPLGDKPKARHSGDEQRHAAAEKSVPGQGNEAVGSASAPLLIPAMGKPIPIRTPAKVMRVWIAPWEDARGVLHGGGYQFIEIETRRWSMGESEEATTPARVFAIQKVDPTEPVGKDPSASATRPGVSEQPTAPTLPKPGASSWSAVNRGSQPPP